MKLTGGRHSGFARHEGLAGGPGSLAERSAAADKILVSLKVEL